MLSFSPDSGFFRTTLTGEKQRCSNSTAHPPHRTTTPPQSTPLQQQMCECRHVTYIPTRRSRPPLHPSVFDLLRRTCAAKLAPSSVLSPPRRERAQSNLKSSKMQVCQPGLRMKRGWVGQASTTHNTHKNSKTKDPALTKTLCHFLWPWWRARQQVIHQRAANPPPHVPSTFQLQNPTLCLLFASTPDAETRTQLADVVDPPTFFVTQCETSPATGNWPYCGPPYPYSFFRRAHARTYGVTAPSGMAQATPRGALESLQTNARSHNGARSSTFQEGEERRQEERTPTSSSVQTYTPDSKPPSPPLNPSPLSFVFRRNRILVFKREESPSISDETVNEERLNHTSSSFCGKEFHLQLRLLRNLLPQHAVNKLMP